MSKMILPLKNDKEIYRMRNFHMNDEVYHVTEEIVNDVLLNGMDALMKYIEMFEEAPSGGNIFYSKEEMKMAFDKISTDRLKLFQRVATRIKDFAQAQKQCIKEMEIKVLGGIAGHFIAPVMNAGCYTPGGRYSLPSSLLMSVITARCAGVENVWVACPNPDTLVLACAWIAGADGVLSAGGAHAIAALAKGIWPVPACDIIVGPGNSYVTAAKQIVSRFVGIDMLAGPSELVIIADESSSPDIISADLLSQAEHDPDALVGLICTERKIYLETLKNIKKNIKLLKSASIAKSSLSKGFCCIVGDLDEAALISNKLSPEHLSLHLKKPDTILDKLTSYGTLFIGEKTSEVIGDYGAGPNHTLPTEGRSRYTGGLSVFNFLRIRTWIKISDLQKAKTLYSDARDFAEIEGLYAHREAAMKRIKGTK